MYQTVTEGLQTLYTKKLLPLEETYLFHDFHSPALEAADFQSKPMVLLVGQYSTGKTTFIRYSAAADDDDDDPEARSIPGCASCDVQGPGSHNKHDALGFRDSL